MTNIQAISKDILEVYYNNTIFRLETGDKIQFMKSYEIYDKGDCVTVSPEIKDNTYMLKLWSEEYSVKLIDEDSIYTLISDGIVQKL